MTKFNATVAHVGPTVFDDGDIAGWLEKRAPRVFDLDEDPLAYFVRWSRTDYSLVNQFGRISDVFDNWAKICAEEPDIGYVSNEDRLEAKQIRRYYQNKIMDLGLRGEEITPFRHRLYDALEKQNQITDADVGVFYRLPAFYAEDMFLDQIVEDSASIETVGHELDDVYEYLGSCDRVTQRIRQRRHWFRSQRQELACFFMGLTDSAIPIVDQYLQVGKLYDIQAPVTGAVRLYTQQPNFLAHYLSNKYTIKEHRGS